MKFLIKQTTLTDGSKVFAVDLFANGYEKPHKNDSKQVCIFSCNSKKDADEFLKGLRISVEKHTVEILEQKR